MLELHTPIQYVKGIGPRVSAMLNEKGIYTVEDLLYYLPFRYEDRANPKSLAELKPGETASIIAEVRSFHLYRTAVSGRRSSAHLSALRLPHGQEFSVWLRGTD